MPGIEFVGADADDQADDDVLDTGPRRPWPRWVWVVAALLVLAVVGVVVSARSGDAPKAAPSTAVSSTAASTTPIPARPVAQISALTSDGSSLYWLAGGRLYRAGPVGRPSISAAVDAVADDFVETQLVPDPGERTVWLVSRGSADVAGAAGDVQGFGNDDLSRVARISAPSLIDGAAAFGGGLYVLSGGRLLRATAGGHAFVTVARVDRHARGLVAAGDALLYVEGGNGSAIGRWTPGGGVHPPVVLDTTDNALAVVGSTVFVAGTRRGHDVLDTLPRIGQPAEQDLATDLTDLQLVASGRASQLVLGTDEQGLELACVTVRTGSDFQSPNVQALAAATSANVAVLGGIVFQAEGDGVRPVSFPPGGCPG